MNEIKSYWQNYKFLNNVAKDRKIVLFGRSEDWIPKLIRKLNRPPFLICDSNKDLDQSEFLNIKVVHKSKVIKKIKDVFFVITSGNYRSIIQELRNNGYKEQKDFICCPDFKDFAYLDKVRNTSGEILFTSSDHIHKKKTKYQKATRFSIRGGGIFCLKFNPLGSSIEKKVDGSFKQIIRVDKKRIASINYYGKIFILSNKYKVIEKLNVGISNLCGIDYIKKKNIFILSNQTRDIVYLYDPKIKKIVDQINFSNLSGEHKESYHHINDIFYYKNNLYVTFFSESGTWKEGLYDGGIAKISLDTKKVYIIEKGYFQPHSPCIIDGEIAFVDSGNRKLILGPHKKRFEFNGFIRGMKEFGGYIFLGQSETMYLTRMIVKGDLINISSGIHIIDYEYNARRFLGTPGITNIHDVLPIQLM